MSMTFFVAICILGSDFLLYAFFQWTYGEKRRLGHSSRRNLRNASNLHSPLPVVIPSRSASADSGPRWNERLAYHTIVSSFPPPRR